MLPTIIALLVTLVGISSICVLIYRIHHWGYSNPFNRTCRICHQQEIEHYLPGSRQHSWGEIFDDGDYTKHPTLHRRNIA